MAFTTHAIQYLDFEVVKHVKVAALLYLILPNPSFPPTNPSLLEMSTGDDPTLSRLREALKPYIRNRQEALRIRRILSLYIGSAIGGSGESIISPISLATPGRDGYVKAVPPDLSGVRKDYLLALQANIKAREEYERTVQGLSPANETDNDLRQRQQGETHVRSVSTYLDLLELQKRYEKLKVIKNLLRVLQKEEPAKQDYLSIDWVKQEANAADDLLPTYENQTTVDPSRNDAQSQLLMSRLEKAVLCASETVKREKGLLEELRAKRGTCFQSLFFLNGPTLEYEDMLRECSAQDACLIFQRLPEIGNANSKFTLIQT